MRVADAEEDAGEDVGQCVPYGRGGRGQAFSRRGGFRRRSSSSHGPSFRGPRIGMMAAVSSSSPPAVVTELAAGRESARHVRLDYSRHPVHGHLPNERIRMLHREDQTLQYLVEVHLLLIAPVLEVLVVHEQLRQDRLQELQRQLSYRGVGIGHHGEYPPQEQVQEFEYGSPHELLTEFLQPRKRELLRGLVPHVHEPREDGDARVGAEAAGIDRPHDDLLQLLVEQLGAAPHVEVDVRVQAAQYLEQYEEMLHGEAGYDLRDVEQAFRGVIPHALGVILTRVHDAREDEIPAFGDVGPSLVRLLEPDRARRQRHRAPLPGILVRAADVIVRQQQQYRADPAVIGRGDEGPHDLLDLHRREPPPLVPFVGEAYEDRGRYGLLERAPHRIAFLLARVVSLERRGGRRAL
mmetsp:Transcript_37374/g.90181  ORF Transcript_37374/g.90181 Transcript_37374/m.90181 type:complete len:408 (-) Transcript_37374:462-1685(-)